MSKKTAVKISSFLLLVAFLITSCNTNSSADKKKISIESTEEIHELNISKSAVYTTETLSDVKLQLMSKDIAFSDFIQPLETQASIFVNTSKSFPTFVGIGAALSDASAETFYKLSKENQDKFMEAYYSS